MPKIKNICISQEKGPKSEISQAQLLENWGMEHDYHAQKDSDRQISLLTVDMIDQIVQTGLNIHAGDFGENIIVEGLEFDRLKKAKSIIINDQIHIQITIIGKDCQHPCQIYQKIGWCIMPKYGIFGKVLKGGIIKIGDTITHYQ